MCGSCGSAHSVWQLLRKDNSPSVLKRRVELLEDDVRRLTTESEQKTVVIDTQEKKIEKMTDEQIELQVAWWGVEPVVAISAASVGER